jgi:hypothetical protein
MEREGVVEKVKAKRKMQNVKCKFQIEKVPQVQY